MRFRCSFALVSLLLCLFSACARQEARSGGKAGTNQAVIKRILLLNNTDTPFWDAARVGIAQAVKDLNLEEHGYTAAMDSNDGTESGQIEKLRQYGTQSDIAAVIISPTSATNAAIADELNNLKNQGVLIGCFDSDLDPARQSIREFYVGTNNRNAGKALAVAVKQLRPDGGAYAQFVGLDTQQNSADRMDSITENLGDRFIQKDRHRPDVDLFE